MSAPEPNEAHRDFALVMPFVATQSNGGEYDDHAYVGGYELGVLDGQLTGTASPTPENPGPPAPGEWRWIQKGNADQADLVAMKHGMRIEFGETYAEYVAVRVVSPNSTPESETGETRQ